MVSLFTSLWFVKFLLFTSHESLLVTSKVVLIPYANLSLTILCSYHTGQIISEYVADIIRCIIIYLRKAYYNMFKNHKSPGNNPEALTLVNIITDYTLERNHDLNSVNNLPLVEIQRQFKFEELLKYAKEIEMTSINALMDTKYDDHNINSIIPKRPKKIVIGERCLKFTHLRSIFNS